MILKRLLKNREAVLLILIIALVGIISAINPVFFDGKNFMDILRNSSYVTIAALGMSMIIITGGIDVSMGSVMSVLALTCGSLAVANVPLPLWILITVVIGGMIGSLNGVFITKTRVPPLICTLAMSSIASGTIIVLTEGKWVVGVPDSFNIIGKGSVFGIPISVLVMLGVLAWAMWFMSRSRLGRSIYAVGGNQVNARLTSINVDRVLILTYAIGGILLAVATVVYASRLKSITSDCGTNFHIQLIAAAVIGGTNILGGKGKPLGVFLGAVTLEIFRSSLVYLNISTYWEQAVQGALILLAILTSALDSHMDSKRTIKKI